LSGLSIIGLQWGDEAKGKLVDLLTPNCDIVVRYQGGANAGHTVVVGNESYKLHLIPSGILNQNVLNVVTGGVVINPATMLVEIDGIVNRGINIENRLWISDRAHVVFPWHIAEDRAWDLVIKGAANIGTTMRGIGPCYRDKVGRSFAIRMGDLLRPDLRDRIQEILKMKKLALASFDSESIGIEALNAETIYEEYRQHAQRLAPYICDTNAMLLDAVEQDKRLLFEGAQGALLDIDHGTFPFVTSSNSSGVGISSGSGVPPKWITTILGVAKCYSTRVGGGPFPTELHDETGNHIREIGKEYGTTTGRPRRCGWFDAVAVRYTARLSGISGLCMMMLDVLSELNEIKICTGYTLQGKRLDSFPSNADDLRDVELIFETMPGWNTDITGVRQYEQLPQNARNYLQRISELVGKPIEIVSVGPDRAQTIPVGNLFRDKVLVQF
jgi:adenylosuccinate synthase